jgi:hypothetical protein
MTVQEIAILVLGIIGVTAATAFCFRAIIISWFAGGGGRGGEGGDAPNVGASGGSHEGASSHSHRGAAEDWQDSNGGGGDGGD